MAPVYSTAAINARLQAIIDTIDGFGAGFLQLLDDSAVVSTIQLAEPCGSVNGGVLTFTGPRIAVAAGTGNINAGQITNGFGAIVASGLTAGIPGSSADIILNGSISVSAGQPVTMLSGQIVGS